MGVPHALLLPFPAQGHVIPLMELAYCLLEQGFKITFVNTEFNHGRLLASLSSKNCSYQTGDMRLISVPDGLAPDGDRDDLGRLCDSLVTTVPRYLEEIIRKSNEPGEVKITSMVADQTMAWALHVAEKMMVRCAVFWSASAGLLITLLNVNKLIEDGIVDEDGDIKRAGKFQLGPGMPFMEAAHLAWNCFPDAQTKKTVFRYFIVNNQATELAEFIVCNSFHELEEPTFTFAPNLIPIGPLRTGQRLGNPAGHFWPEDYSCISWLDKQQPNSVIYVAFGSFTIFDKHQFEELALGLELSGRPFLCVVRPNLTDEASTYPDGYEYRIAGRGRIVSWSPQQKVLAHPSVACFISHCGWNSTMEGVSNGVPFLCWPYFADQFLNESYISDIWRIGLRLSPDENGIVSREQIRSRIEELLGDDEIKGRVLALKEKAKRSVCKEGTSFKNLNSFIDAMK